jgi:hypothetical protein
MYVACYILRGRQHKVPILRAVFMNGRISKKHQRIAILP